MAFRLCRVRLRLQHFWHRLPLPRHSRLCGTFLLILDPVQYELAPLLRWDKATTLRQKLVLVLVKDVLYRAAHHSCQPPKLDLKITAADDERLAKTIQDS